MRVTVMQRLKGLLAALRERWEEDQRWAALAIAGGTALFFCPPDAAYLGADRMAGAGLALSSAGGVGAIANLVARFGRGRHR